MVSLLYLLSALALADAPKHVSLRSCGAAQQTLTLYRAERTLGQLGLHLSAGVDGATPVLVLSNTDLDETTARHMALDVASALGYTVRNRRGVVRVPRDGALETEATALVLIDSPDEQLTQDAQSQRVNGRSIVVWPGAVSLARLLRLVADSVGITPEAVVDSAFLPEEDWLASARELLTQESGEDEESDEPSLLGSGTGVDLSRTQLWTGDTGSLCDLLADRLEPIFLLEEGRDVDIMVTSVGPISVLDALDILSTVAPDFGVSVVEDGDMVLIQQADPPAEAFDAPLITLIPAGETLYGMTPEALQHQTAGAQLGSLNMRSVLTRSGSLVMLVSEDGMFSHIPVPEPPSRGSMLSLDGAGITTIGEGQFRVARGTFDGVDAFEDLMSMVRLVPHKDEQGEVDGYRMSGIRRGSVARKLGFLNGDILHSVNDVVVGSMSTALEVVEGLQDADHVTVQVFRRSQLLTRTYEVVPADAER